MFLLCASFLRLGPHCSAWGKRKMSLRIHFSRPSHSYEGWFGWLKLVFPGLVGPQSQKKEVHNNNIVTPSRALDQIRSMMTSQAVLLFTFEDCKTIQSIQNKHCVTSSSSGFGLFSYLCRQPQQGRRSMLAAKKASRPLLGDLRLRPVRTLGMLYCRQIVANSSFCRPFHPLVGYYPTVKKPTPCRILLMMT